MTADDALTHPARTIADIAYVDPDPAETVGNLLDVHVPAAAAGARLPAVVWATGSAWRADDGKEGAASVVSELNSRGYVVVGVSIRSSAQVRFPGQLYDIRAAIRHVRARAAEYSIDPDRIAIMGQSSGGWTTAMAAVTSSMLHLDGEHHVGGVSSAVQAAVSFFPPVDFAAMDSQTVEQRRHYEMEGDPVIAHDAPTSPESLLVGCPIQECPDRARAASPLSYVDGSEPPLALFHGTHDPLLPPGQSRALYEALRDAGAGSCFTLVAGAGHRVQAPPMDEPPGALDRGAPIIDAQEYQLMSATGGVETVGVGVEPTWDAIDAFLTAALDQPATDDPDDARDTAASEQKWGGASRQ